MPEFRARYEFKYLISQEEIDYIRSLTLHFCDYDAYGVKGVYDVTSLYFDTWDHLLAHQTIDGIRNRYKLRIRTYGWEDTDAVFLEIKGRVGTSILKQRALMDRKYVEDVCLGNLHSSGEFLAAKPSHQDDLCRFRNRMDAVDARPRMWIRYQREAFGSRFGDGARLTFDSSLVAQLPDDIHPFIPDHKCWHPVHLDAPEHRQTILEMKFNGAFPFWMQRLVDQLELKRVSCSKYVQGVEQHGDVPWGRVEKGGPWTVF